MRTGDLSVSTARNARPCAAGIVLALSVLMLISCAPSFRANLDRTLTGQIIWPSPPEEPRIKYLWSLVALHPDEKRVADLFFGPDAATEDIKMVPYLMRPYGLCVDPGNNLYIVDQGPPRLTIVNLNTMDVKNIGIDGEGMLLMPIAVAVDDTGKIYVSDSEDRRVKIYAQDGKFLGYLSDEETLKRPTGLAFDALSRKLFVLDTPEHRVHAFIDGKHEMSFGQRGAGDGEFNYPTHIATGSNGHIYITDTMNFRVQVFDNSGNFITAFGKLGDSYNDLNRPKGIAADSFGNIYVVDNAADMVKIFNEEGKLLLFFGENGRLPGKFVMPSGIFIDNKNIIYVADTYNMRVQAFQLIKGEG